ncbi:unnamed protein product [Mycena citricolor]|uniref:DUF7330 domain-containing protein n=1 Tax=Mycena citricolor TaxID=2018698 RepID=A0AAD2GR61_9AGAR|nr:unnamed protein product [Mycena citricolor]
MVARGLRAPARTEETALCQIRRPLRHAYLVGRTFAPSPEAWRAEGVLRAVDRRAQDGSEFLADTRRVQRGLREVVERREGPGHRGRPQVPLFRRGEHRNPHHRGFLFVVSHAVRHHTVLAGGRVQFVQSEEVGDKLQIGVTAHVHREKDLKHVKTCLLEGEAGARGAGLFTNWVSKSHHRHRRQPRFRLDVVVAFPATDKDSSLAVKEFWTNMTAFSQEFYDLSGVAFDSLNVRNFLGPISAENLKAKAANIETDFGPIRIGSLNVTAANVTTTMGPISGSFFASDSLSLKTSNGPILAHIELSDTDAKKGPAQLQLHTSNGIIDSSVDLSTTKDESAFDLIAKTSNGRLALAVPSAPIDSTITLDARTAFGSAHVKLPATFEGAFSASTSIGAASLKADENAPDPSGQGRARKVVVDAAGARTSRAASAGARRAWPGAMPMSRRASPVLFWSSKSL